MKFGEKPISKCIGDLLVHSVKLPDGKLPKGTSLSKAHIQKLRSVGITSLLVASLEEGDVDDTEDWVENRSKLEELIALNQNQEYKVFCRDFDEVVDADNLCSSE